MVRSDARPQYLHKPRGDQQNRPFFEQILPKVYERRRSSGLSQVGHAIASMAELAHYIGEIYSSSCCSDVESKLEPQTIRFVDPGDCIHPFDALKPLTFTFLSDDTYNRVVYTDVPLDSLAGLDPGDRVLLDDEPLAVLKKAADKHERNGLAGRVLGIDHLAIGVMAGEREGALLEYPTMVPYSFWESYNIREMNSSTNVPRHPGIGDAKSSSAGGGGHFQQLPFLSPLRRQSADVDRALHA